MADRGGSSPDDRLRGLEREEAGGWDVRGHGARARARGREVMHPCLEGHQPPNSAAHQTERRVPTGRRGQAGGRRRSTHRCKSVQRRALPRMRSQLESCPAHTEDHDAFSQIAGVREQPNVLEPRRATAGEGGS